MSDSAFRAVRFLIRAIPDALRGKTRVARIVLRPFINKNEPTCLSDRFGNVLRVPSLREPIALGLFASGIYEPDTLGAILANLRPSGTYIDVGANVGALALPVAAQRPDTQIVAIEGDPDIATILRSNVTKNKRSNVRVIECLAGPKDDLSVPFFAAPVKRFGMGSIGPQFHASPLMLRQRALDGILDELSISDVDVVKLDIEGAELGALRGLQRRLRSSKPPIVIFEFADWAECRIEGQMAGDAQRFLLSIGYQLFSLTRAGASGEVLRHPLTTGAAMILALPAAPVLPR